MSIRHESNKSHSTIAPLVATVALSACLLAGCSNSDQARARLKQEAEDGYGVMRTVTAYSQTGEEIGSWHGKIDIEYGTTGDKSGNKVDLVFFDGSEPVDRVILSGPVIVVADNDSYSEQEYATHQDGTPATEADADGDAKAPDAAKATEKTEK